MPSSLLSTISLPFFLVMESLRLAQALQFSRASRPTPTSLTRARIGSLAIRYSQRRDRGFPSLRTRAKGRNDDEVWIQDGSSSVTETETETTEIAEDASVLGLVQALENGMLLLSPDIVGGSTTRFRMPCRPFPKPLRVGLNLYVHILLKKKFLLFGLEWKEF